jgi:integrase
VSTWLVYAEGIREHIDAARRRQAHHSAQLRPHTPTCLTCRKPKNGRQQAPSQNQVQITYATWLLRRGAGMESVKGLLGHASIATTIDTYGHLTVEDARATLAAAGWFTGREVQW